MACETEQTKKFALISDERAVIDGTLDSKKEVLDGFESVDIHRLREIASESIKSETLQFNKIQRLTDSTESTNGDVASFELNEWTVTFDEGQIASLGIGKKVKFIDMSYTMDVEPERGLSWSEDTTRTIYIKRVE